MVWRGLKCRWFSSPPLNISKYLSNNSKRRQPSPIRKLQPLIAVPGMISLGGGLPNPQLFPFAGFSFKLGSGENIELSQKELDEALQYSPTPGLPVLVSELQKLQRREHQADALPEWQLSVTTGSQDALNKAFEMLIQEGDTVLVENPTYSGALACLRPLGCQLEGVDTDHHGLLPNSLEKALRRTYNKQPRVLYTIVTGQNPSGATLSLERKRQIYQLACDHDLIILEDDPYRYLEYGPDPAPEDDTKFTRPINKSFFSMDTQGRVIRFDSLSKVLSSGLRLGFVTGPSAFIRQIDLASQASPLHTSGISQMLAAKLLEKWGSEGWTRHCDAVALFYARRRDRFISLCDKYLRGKATWGVPSAGMFVWLHLEGVKDSQRLIEERALSAKVLLLHGSAFLPQGGVSPFVRASFSTANDEEMELGVQRLSALLDE